MRQISDIFASWQSDRLSHTYVMGFASVTMTVVFGVFLATSRVALARQPLVPLMPSKGSANDALYTTSVSKKAKVAHSELRWGIELGILGRDTSTQTDILGFQTLWGGRVSARMELGNHFSLKPSLGYFRKNQSEGFTQITQNNFELGIGVGYAVWQNRSLRWNANLLNRVDISFSSLQIGSASDTSPAVMRYRLGPGTGVGIDLGSKFELTVDIEYTIGVTSPQRNFGGLMTGLQFQI